jgi:hypothetical protein
MSKDLHITRISTTLQDEISGMAKKTNCFVAMTDSTRRKSSVNRFLTIRKRMMNIYRNTA